MRIVLAKCEVIVQLRWFVYWNRNFGNNFKYILKEHNYLAKRLLKKNHKPLLGSILLIIAII